MLECCGTYKLLYSKACIHYIVITLKYCFARQLFVPIRTTYHSNIITGITCPKTFQAARMLQNLARINYVVSFHCPWQIMISSKQKLSNGRCTQMALILAHSPLTVHCSCRMFIVKDHQRNSCLSTGSLLGIVLLKSVHHAISQRSKYTQGVAQCMCRYNAIQRLSQTWFERKFHSNLLDVKQKLDTQTSLSSIITGAHASQETADTLLPEQQDRPSCQPTMSLGRSHDVFRFCPSTNHYICLCLIILPHTL